ncbi:MAG TPA: sugar phosphate isomerase/epimerase [Candidatus Limnocylindrales bacterium]|nr:sugar phosphate isomerase/epimerase [Candidatus Limnocylindrales bacterium]
MIRIANAPCSWGVIENVEGETGGYRRVLDEMAETGYAGTELGDWGFMPTDPSELRAELDARGLEMLASFATPWLQDPARHAQGEADAVKIAKLLAAVGGPETMIVLGNDPYGDPVRGKNAGRITPEMGLTDEQWDVYAAAANQLARRVRDEAGIRTVVHQHLGTLIETGAEVRRLMAMTDPDLLGICLDTGHWTFGTGENPVDAVREFGDRIWHVHFKDADPAVMTESRANKWDGITSTGHGVFCELGKGSVDFPGVLAALTETGYDGWIVVEQDILPGMGNPRESARRNREYLRGIGL